MKFYSEKVKKFFDSAEECEKAEILFDDKQKEIAKKKEKAIEDRKAKAKEVENALNEVAEAKKKYKKAIEEFCKEYGAYHYTTKSTNAWNDFLDMWF